MHATADFDLAPVIPGNILRPQSMVHLEYANRAVKLEGTLKPQNMFGGAVQFDEASHVTVSWSSATKQVKVDGSAHADVNKLATVDLTVKGNAGGDDPASFDLDGKIDATGLRKYIKGVDFGSITGEVKLHVGGGTQTDFKVSVDADVTGIPAAGITDCQAHIHGEFEKGQGLSGFVQVQRIKIGNVIGDGRVDLKNNKFASGELHILADFPSIKIEGTGHDRAERARRAVDDGGSHGHARRRLGAVEVRALGIDPRRHQEVLARRGQGRAEPGAAVVPAAARSQGRHHL